MKIITQEAPEEEQNRDLNPDSSLSSQPVSYSRGASQFLKGFFITAAAAFLIYYGAILLMMTIGAPIAAEYWVGEAIAIKKEIVKAHSGERKILLAGGSSTLFGVDAQEASKRLNLPVINFGLHAALRLDEILWQVGTAAEPNDIVILLLEPKFFKTRSELTFWQLRNLIGWDRDGWKEMSWVEKGELVHSIPPSLLFQMLGAEYDREFSPLAVANRLETTDHAQVLTKFKNREQPKSFAYSAYNLDNFGDMLMTEGCQLEKSGTTTRPPDHVEPQTARLLQRFVSDMKSKRVEVFFANAPYIAWGASQASLREADDRFLREFSSIGRMIDRREDLVFDAKYFFNTVLHLNSEGRSLRTDRLISAIRQNVLGGAAVSKDEINGHPSGFEASLSPARRGQF